MTTRSSISDFKRRPRPARVRRRLKDDALRQRADKIPITPEQCRMARAALQMTVRQLAERTGVSPSLITRFENDRLPHETDTLSRLRIAFEARGIEFILDDVLGVQLRNPAS